MFSLNQNRTIFYSFSRIILSMTISFVSYSHAGFLQKNRYTQPRDTLKKDSIKPIEYVGLSKNVVEYLNNTNAPNFLAQYLAKNFNVLMDDNQAKLMNVVASHYGLADILGDSNNTQVLQFFIDVDHPEITNDDMSWCSAYMCWCAKQVDLERTNSLMARYWLEVGRVVEKPQTGDIVIFWREKQRSWQGHVAIFINEDPITHQIFCLGGNQDDKVCVKPYPSEQLLGYRRLSILPEPEVVEEVK